MASLTTTEASEECTVSTAESLLNILATPKFLCENIVSHLAQNPLPRAVLVPVMSVWRLLVVSQQRFCEDKAEL